ncbi:MAG: TetR/AcrR family transcriptional regulator [Clostridia bacterium]|nr:TetR/AcrR family transcriptional regulator [Clostridia bacterium]
MNKKEDARVIRTKAKLFSSFRQLLSEKTFEEITINEICIRSDIRRATFYKHFSDKYDFLAGLVGHLRHNFEERFDTDSAIGDNDLSAYYLEYLKAIISFLDANEEIVKLIFDSNIAPALVEVIIDENYKKTKEKLESDLKRGLKLIASADTVAIYLAGGIAHTLIKWLKAGKQTSPDSLGEEIIAIICSAFVK